MSDIVRHYADRDTCLRELYEARQLWGSKETSADRLAAMDKALGLMYLYCPSDLTDIVLATIDESERRQELLRRGRTDVYRHEAHNILCP